MKQIENSPFGRTNKTQHTPPKSNQNQKQTTAIKYKTRQQSRQEEKVHTPKETAGIRDTPEQRKEVTEEVQEAPKTIQEATIITQEVPKAREEAQLHKAVEQQNTKMDQKQIQRLIADNAIPEFNGENRVNELARFIGIADNIYSTLATEAERNIFTNLIKFKLTGDAYTRISHREVENYETLKQILSNMYAKTYTLNELERQFMDIQQRYGETARNYGYRLMEALDQYKTGYKSKYELQALDDSYKSHLNTTAVQSFKKGLNNTILKEKIATIKANNVDEIIKETEQIEHMLETLTNHPTTSTQRENPQQTQPSNTRQNTTICHYCHKPNHTWAICRSRLATLNNPQQTRQQFQAYNNYRTNIPQNYSNISPRPFVHNPNRFQPTNQNNHQTSNQNRFQSQNQNRYQQPQQNNQNNFSQYRQPQQRNNYEPKYCSHCKTTTGHTFEECKSKFLGPRTYSTNDFPRQQQQPQQPQQQQTKDNLEDAFKNMQIRQIMPQQLDQHYSQQMYPQQDQGNANGSNQQ